MLPIRKWCRVLYWLFVLTLLSAIARPAISADEEVPAGFKADRYQRVWERNPFTLVTPPAQQVRTTPFDKLILVSWLNDGAKDVVFVQNAETSEVQKVTNVPNPNNLRLVAINKNADPKKADVVLSNGAEQGSVRFRLEMPMAGPQVSSGQQPPGTPMGGQNAVGAAPGVPGAPDPRMSRKMQMQQNAQQALQQAVPVQAVPMQQGAAAMQPANGTMPPRASEVRRKRITPPPPNEQPVGAPAPYQAPSNQPAPR